MRLPDQLSSEGRVTTMMLAWRRSVGQVRNAEVDAGATEAFERGVHCGQRGSFAVVVMFVGLPHQWTYPYPRRPGPPLRRGLLKQESASNSFWICARASGWLTPPAPTLGQAIRSFSEIFKRIVFHMAASSTHSTPAARHPIE